MIPLSRPNLTDAEREAAWQVLSGDAISNGPAVAAFEQAVAQYVNAQHAVAVSSATAGLHLAVRALRLRNSKPDKPLVAMPALTFVATAHAVLYEGLTPLFVDIDPATGLMDMAALAAALQHHPVQGIMPVDYAGRGLDATAIEQLRQLATQYDCWVVEDASHGIGGRDGSGKRIGACSYAHAAVFSLHATKNLTAGGEGGIVTTNDAALADFLRLHRAHGIRRGAQRLVDDTTRPWRYELDYPGGIPGMNYRLADVLAAVAHSQLARVDAIRDARAERAAAYHQALSSLPGLTLLPLDSAEPGLHARHLYVVRHPQRNALYRHLAAAGIQSQVHYTPVHQYLPANSYVADTLTHTEAFASTCLSLPCFELLTWEEHAAIVAAVQSFAAASVM